MQGTLVLVKPKVMRCSAAVLDALLDFFFVDILDPHTWCRFRAACKRVNVRVQASQRNLNMHAVNCIRQQAGERAEPLLRKYWSQENLRCSFEFCCNNRQQKTGRFCPPRAIFWDPEETNIAKSLWWKNKHDEWKHVLCHTPQLKLTTVIDEATRCNATKYCYVACSERCFYDIRQAAETIHWRNTSEVKVFLGIDKLPLRNVDPFYDDFSEPEAEAELLDIYEDGQSIRVTTR